MCVQETSLLKYECLTLKHPYNEKKQTCLLLCFCQWSGRVGFLRAHCTWRMCSKSLLESVGLSTDFYGVWSRTLLVAPSIPELQILYFFFHLSILYFLCRFLLCFALLWFLREEKHTSAHKAAQAKYLPLEIVPASSMFLYYTAQSSYAKHP